MWVAVRNVLAGSYTAKASLGKSHIGCLLITVHFKCSEEAFMNNHMPVVCIPHLLNCFTQPSDIHKGHVAESPHLDF